MYVDDYGRVCIDENDACDLIHQGISFDGIFGIGEEISKYNQLCKLNDKSYAQIDIPLAPAVTPQEEHHQRQMNWFIPKKYKNIDVWSLLKSRCKNDAELRRLELEKQEYIKREAEPVLRLMFYLVDHFRENNILWGVGRGSSVASFVLYLIGITKINPIKYNLDYKEFFKN